MKTLSNKQAVDYLRVCAKEKSKDFVGIGSYKKDGSYKVRTVNFNVKIGLLAVPAPRYDNLAKGILWAWDMKGKRVSIIEDNIRQLSVNGVKYTVLAKKEVLA